MISVSFRSVARNNILATLVFVAWMKLFKYIAFNKTMTQLSNVLARVRMEKFNKFDTCLIWAYIRLISDVIMKSLFEIKVSFINDVTV